MNFNIGLDLGGCFVGGLKKKNIDYRLFNLLSNMIVNILVVKESNGQN